MLHILTVIGARPQIIKAAALSRAIRTGFAEKIRETIVHTGQHYDRNMSEVFFGEMQIPAPGHNLDAGSSSHGQQTAKMIAGLEELLLSEKPDAVVVYGDTNSTLAGAVAASKLGIPVVHIEAGLRSFNRAMPEEINRVLCDHVSTLLFSPTEAGIANLRKEGIGGEARAVKATASAPAVYHCGDVMYDNSLYFATKAASKQDYPASLQLQEGNYFLATVHRDSNTDDALRLAAIFHALIRVAEKHQLPVVLPLHPRTAKQLRLLPELEKEVSAHPLLRLVPPASYLEMIQLEKNARLVLTDSGGVQKEAFFFRRPCVILRAETEWVELVECGAAILADADAGKIEAAVSALLERPCSFPPFYGDGKAAEFICSQLVRHFSADE